MTRIIRKYLWLFLIFGLVSCRVLPLAPNPTKQPLVPTNQPPATTKSSISSASPTPVSTVSQVAIPTRDISALPAFENLADGWNELYPGGETACARGGTYSFSVRKTNSSKLLVYFEGGGSCYDANTCRVGGNYFDNSINSSFEADNPALKSHGLFALDNPRNPFSDYNIVFINYCTGDAYLGDKSVTYQNGLRSFEVQHKGFINTQTAFSWIYQNIPSPNSVYMVGCSAGVVGSFFNLPYFKQHYLQTPLTIVGDSGGGYLDGPASYATNIGATGVLPSWLPQYQNLISGDILRSRFIFTIPAQAYPDIRVGLVNSENDGVQAEIISRFNSKITLKQVLESNLTDLRSDVPAINSFIGPGDYHCITMSDQFYDYQANGVQLSDWMTNLASP